jgi:hypothetical protein
MAMAGKKGCNPILVGTKVCHHTDGTCMSGMVTAIKTTTKGKQKVNQALYHIQFLDNEKTRCGLERVKEMQEAYVSCRPKVNQKGAGGAKASQSLYPEGFDLYTVGCKPPAFRIGRFDSWLRKAKLRKFHAALNEYEIHYSCGYTRYVKLGDMQQMVTASGTTKSLNQNVFSNW